MKVKVREAKNIFEKSLGLMFKNNPEPLYFETRWGIHTFFIKKPLIVVILDHSNAIVRIKTMMPNRIYFWNPKYKRVVELPQKKDKQTKIKVGDTLGIYF